MHPAASTRYTPVRRLKVEQMRVGGGAREVPSVWRGSKGWPSNSAC